MWCLAEGHNVGDTVVAPTRNPSSSTLPLSHCTPQMYSVPCNKYVGNGLSLPTIQPSDTLQNHLLCMKRLSLVKEDEVYSTMAHEKFWDSSHCNQIYKHECTIFKKFVFIT